MALKGTELYEQLSEVSYSDTLGSRSAKSTCFLRSYSLRNYVSDDGILSV